MFSNRFLKFATAVVAFVVSSACSAALGQPDSGTTIAPSVLGSRIAYIGNMATIDGRPVTAARPGLNLEPDGSAPVAGNLATTASNDYEYIINDYGSYASIFNYPPNTKQVGSIKDVGGQGCTNVLYGYGKKIFWIMASSKQISEYAVPKTLIKSLSDKDGSPSSCAMDGSGDLAVGILYDTNGKGGGNVIIFKDASGPGTIVKTPLAREYFDGYDNKGNLFFDGFDTSGNFELLELPKGSTTVEPITTSNTIQFPGSVQWDGSYLAVTDQATDDIYRYSLDGTNATLRGTTALVGSSDCAQTWIATGVVYCGDAGNGNGEVFKYPAGGSIVATFTGRFDTPLGVVAAEK